MNSEHQTSFAEAQKDPENNLFSILHRYLTYWKWFILSVTIFAAAAYVFIRYKRPTYQASATILVKDEKGGSGLSELSAFEDLGLLNKGKNIDNEIEILKSRQLMGLVVKELRLNIRYFINQRPIEKEFFDDSPIYLRFLNGDSTIYDKKGTLTIIPLDNVSFNLLDKNGYSLGRHEFGKRVASPFGPIAVHARKDMLIHKLTTKEIKVVVSPVEKVTDEYRKKIKIDPVSKTANVIILSLEDAVIEKAVAILNGLIRQHNVDAIADKNLVSKNTSEFINERIEFITAELSTVEGAVENFKFKHGLVDVESEAKLFLQTETAGELEILQANTQKVLAEYMYDYIKSHQTTSDLIPANLGLNDPAVANMISEYNKLVLERNRLLRNSSEKNPVVESLDNQLIEMRKIIKETLRNYSEALNIKLRELAKQESGINSRIAAVPKYERELRNIQRQQQIKETLYLYLLQKREETNIALAVTVANTKVIDRAYSNGVPVSPKKGAIYLAALIVGLLLPVVILYIRDILDNKVHGKRDIDRIGVPFIGDIPQAEKKHKIVVSKGESSSVAEAFRLLRTNVDFMMASHGKHGRTIFVTSTLSKEGKSFVAMNLASSVVLSGKKVLLMGLDIRAPKLLEYFDLGEKPGVTNYISDVSINIEDLLLSVPGLSGFHILPSGSIPPNPSELLMNARISELFDVLKCKYDYIIVDTAPIGMVTDTLLISSYADMFIYVVRAYTLDRRLLSVPENLYKEKRLPNMAVLINGTDKKKAYGYGYGYGYGGYGYGNDKPRPKWKRLLGLS